MVGTCLVGCGDSNNSELGSDSSVISSAASEQVESTASTESVTSSENEASSESESSAVVKGDFLWFAGGIAGLSDEALQKTDLTIPKECSHFFYINDNVGDYAMFKYSDVLESVAFENDDTKLEDSC